MKVDEKLIKDLRSLGATRWNKDPYVYFSHSGGKVFIGSVAEFYHEATQLAEKAANELIRLKKELE